MKILKLSLATAMAVGALSSVSAASLEEAIKDVDVSGFGRYRYQSSHNKVYNPLNEWDKPASVNTKHSSAAFNRFTLDVNFKATLDDNFFSVIGIRYDAISNSGSSKNSADNTHGGLSGVNGGWGGSGNDAFGVRQYYLGYTGIPNTTFLLGRQTIGAFFTDDVVGTGIKAVVTPVDGLTIAAIAFDNIENDSDMLQNGATYGNIVYNNLGFINSATAGKFENDFIDLIKNNAPYLHNLYGAAVIGNFDPVSFQGWYALSQEVAQLWAIEAATNLALSDDIALKARVDVAGTSFRNKYKKTLNSVLGEYTIQKDKKVDAVKNSTFVGAELGTNLFGLDLTAGFLTYGKKKAFSVHTLEDQGGFITAGEELLDYTSFAGKHTAWFGKVAYKYDAYSIGYDFVYDKAKQSFVNNNATNNNFGNIKGIEHVARAGYKYNDKLSFNAWYSYITEKYSNGVAERNDGAKNKYTRFRFDARYNF